MKKTFGFKHDDVTMRKRMTRNRIIAPLVAFMLAAPCCFLLIGGCGKNNPAAPGTTVTLKGNQAFRAAAVAAYQAVGAGVSYPLRALQLASPTGSMLRSMSGTNPLSKSLGLKKPASSTEQFKFIPALNLYLTGGTEGLHGLELLFSIDSAGDQPAGKVTVTLPEGVTILSDTSVLYRSFPQSSTIDIAITGGNLPCTGNLVSKFTDQTGANTLTGTNTLTKDNVVFSLNLSLGDTGVSGSITITESGATIQATNVHGDIIGPLTCDVTINPYGWTGTGTLNLMTGSVTLNVNTGTGTSTASSDNLGNLNINYVDGTPEIVVNALSGGLTATAGTVVFGTLTDTDGNVYKTVKIGNQEWMAENLRVTRYNDGSPILLDTSSVSWDGFDTVTMSYVTTPKYCFFNNTTNADSIKKYGALYNWYVVSPTNPKKIAPVGWHVPSVSDWTVLTKFLGFKDNGRSTDTTYWHYFSLPVGERVAVGNFFINNGLNWTSTTDTTSYGYPWVSGESWIIKNQTDWAGIPAVTGFDTWKNYSGLNVRCVRD